MTSPVEIYPIYVFVYVLAYAYLYANLCVYVCVCVCVSVCAREDRMPSEIDPGHLLKST